MGVPWSIRGIFAHFQNLNLLALLHDLRTDRTARGAWLDGSLLCPIAHGLSTGRQVRELESLGPCSELTPSCHHAARDLGTEPSRILQFVRSWDGQDLSCEVLFSQLNELWEERLSDADAMQELLHGADLANLQPLAREIP